MRKNYILNMAPVARIVHDFMQGSGLCSTIRGGVNHYKAPEKAFARAYESGFPEMMRLSLSETGGKWGITVTQGIRPNGSCASRAGSVSHTLSRTDDPGTLENTIAGVILRAIERSGMKFKDHPWTVRDGWYVKTGNGRIIIRESSDPEYPGVDIECVPDERDYTNGSRTYLTSGTPYTFPRVLIEQPCDDDAPTAYIWIDPLREDFTEKIQFEGYL